MILEYKEPYKEDLTQKEILKVSHKKQKGIDYNLFWISEERGFYTDWKLWGQFSKLDEEKFYYQYTLNKNFTIKTK